MFRMRLLLLSIVVNVLMFTLAFAQDTTPIYQPIADGLTHVIVISLDGARPDAIQQANMPVVQSLAGAGAVAWDAQTVYPPATVPAHASLFTGLDVDEHGVTENSYNTERLNIPTFLSIAAENGTPSAMIVGKNKLDQFHYPDSVYYEFPRSGDPSIVTAAIERLYAGDRLLFVHFPNPDYFGHSDDWMSDSYIYELQFTDAQIGRLLGTLDNMGVRDSTLIIITADHGGHDDLHGANIPEDMTIPLIIAGYGIEPGTILHNAHITQIAPTVLQVLGLDIPENMSMPLRTTFVPTRYAMVRAQNSSLTHRIGVRVVDGIGEFYDTVTGERFVPRGVNYIDWRDTGGGRYADRVFDTRLYDVERVRENFRNLVTHGYNTARIFLDICGRGATCIGNVNGTGLNDAYLDNIVEVMHIAGEEGLYLLLTSNDLPDDGGYWQISDRGITDQFAPYRNTHYLTAPGVESARVYWRDFMNGMAERDAPFEVLLGWSILNEQWFFADQPPLSLNSGTVTTANGQSYDLSDPEQKRAMTTDAIIYYIDAVREVIREYDADTLITMGFFAPRFPNPTETGAGWYVDTAPLLAGANLDFFDFHAYPGGDIDIPALGENFGMIDHPEIPVIMGEVGAFRHSYDNVDIAAIALQEWIAESCEVGYDGWLVWEYFGGPLSIGDATWGMIAENGIILNALSPFQQPDPCQTTDIETSNVAFRQPVTASRALPDEQPENATDGSDAQWGSGDFAPQWVEIDLETPRSIQRITLRIAQYPEGRTGHRVWATLADGTRILLSELVGETRDDQILVIELPVPLADVQFVRVETLESPSWVSWKEIEVYTGDVLSTTCIVQAGGTVNMRSGAGTNFDSTGALPVGTGAFVDGRTTGADGFTWWHIAQNLWVREDVVQATGDCESVSVLENE